MYSASYVDKQIEILKQSGIPFSEAAWKAALLCVGWPYVFGAWGAECTVSERKKRYRDDHPTIKTACKAYNGGSCSGCEWFPDEQRVRCFDCRGFTDFILKRFGFDLVGEGVTSQWNTASNWKAKGLVSDGIPKDTLVCLFYPKKDNPKKMAHTGFGYNGETCECSSGVQHFSTMKAKWTHWAAPAYDSEPVKDPEPVQKPVDENKPTIRRGSKGEYVTLAQTKLLNKGYDLGKWGVDGSFGSATEAAVKNFQRDNGLTADGIIGKNTWAALEEETAVQLYTVHIPFLPLYKAEALIASYTGAYKTQE